MYEEERAIEEHERGKGEESVGAVRDEEYRAAAQNQLDGAEDLANM